MLRKSKTIQDIYNEIKDFDLVITNDAPLATALNRQVTTPRLDYLAATPRQLASKFASLNFGKLHTRPEIILEITKQTGKPLKIIHQSVDRIFDMWNHTGLIESCKLSSPNDSELIDLIEKLASIELAMEQFNEAFYGKKKIAVVGIEMFTELDKQVLPKNTFYETIGLFTEEENSIRKSYLFSSANQLINRTVELINNENENEVAIVLNADSEYLDVIKSRLMEKGVNLQIKSYLSNYLKALDILAFMEASLSADDLRVKDAAVIESLFKEKVDSVYNQYSFSTFINTINKNKTLKLIYDLMSGVRDYTYKDFLDFINKKLLVGIPFELTEAVHLLELAEIKITSDSLNLLKYFIRNIDIETSQAKEGVIFVNALNSSYIDRQIIFYIGLDDSWARINPDKSYVDKKDEEKKNFEKFEILMSQGDYKYFFLLNSKHNQRVLPCYYFNALVDKEISSFEHKFFNAVTLPPENPKPDDIVINKPAPADKLPEQTFISPSSMNSFVSCPKKYSFSRIVKQENNPYFLKGTLLHAFADFYFNHPQYTREHFDELLQYLIDEYEGILSRTNVHAEKTVFSIGMKMIMKFLDDRKFPKTKSDSPEAQPENLLFRKTGLKKLYTNTEQWIESPSIFIKGKIDLSTNNVIVDYKSGKEKEEESHLLEEFKMHRLEKLKSPQAGFQTVAYIAGTRNNHDQDIEFTYFFFLAEYRNIIKEEYSEGSMLSTIRYIPKTFAEYLVSEEAFKEGLKVRKMKEHKTDNIFLERLGYDNYRSVIIAGISAADFYDKDSVSDVYENEFYKTALEKAGITHKEFGKQKEKTFKDHIIGPVIKYIYEIRNGFKGKGYIFKDDVDEFVELVRKVIYEINESRNSYFKSRPLFNMREVCEECDYLNICIENKLWSADESS